jgi:uncharacterized protein (DUF2147 family)
MRKTYSLIGFMAATAGLLSAQPAADVSGAWAGQLRGQGGGTGAVRIVLKQTGNQISGTAGPSEKQNPPQIYDGKLEGNHLTFAADDSDDSGLKLTYHFDFTVSGDHMQGKAHGQSGDKSWVLDISADRQK